MNVIAFATQVGNLYHLEYCLKMQHLNRAVISSEQLCHRRFGRVGKEKLKALAHGNVMNFFAYDSTNNLELCESCVGGKQHHTPFKKGSRHVANILELVHSDLCGKISEECFMGGAQYFLTFRDHKSRYLWVYFLKTKD